MPSMTLLLPEAFAPKDTEDGQEFKAAPGDREGRGNFLIRLDPAATGSCRAVVRGAALLRDGAEGNRVFDGTIILNREVYEHRLFVS